MADFGENPDQGKFWNEASGLSWVENDRLMSERLETISQLLLENLDLHPSSKILDIGCGGGLLAEPMARLGGTVTGIDATPQAIDAARTHAAQSGLDIDYRCVTAEALAETGAVFDVIYASEVIEHVTDRRLFAASIAAMLAPGGTVVITTINRTLASLALAKVALEYIFRLVPAGTHDPARFVKPSELRAEFAASGIVLDDMTGFAPRPARRIGANGFFRTASLAVNYAASGTSS